MKIDAYLKKPAKDGPIAAMICEDAYLAAETADWLSALGFGTILAIGPGARAAVEGAAVEGAGVERAAVEGAAADVKIVEIAVDVFDPVRRTAALNRLIDAHHGQWMLLCHTGEFLFFPFCGTRSVCDLTDFVRSERRSAAMAYVVDLYGEGSEPDFSPQEAYFDAEGWYAFDHGDGSVEVFGGLEWRFEDMVRGPRSPINRPALFLAGPGSKLRPDNWFEDPALNGVSCPWHHNPTLALMSVRRARRLLATPGFAERGRSFLWRHSVRFDWRPEQLTAMGVIEPGQWI